MPVNDRRRRPAAGLTIGLALLLAACAVPPQPEGESEAGLGPAERVAALLTGRYAGRLRDAPDSSPVVVEVRTERVGVEGVDLVMTQTGPGREERAFGLRLEPTRVPTRLGGRFAPLDARGSALGACPLSVAVRSDGFVATTDAGSCRFGAGPDSRALVKEIAHNGQRLLIADRVVVPATGEPIGDDRVLELARVRAFEVWAGVRDGAGAAWRIAETLEVFSDGAEHRPVDAAGAPLGFSFELAPHPIRDGEPPVLRLRVFDEHGGLLAQAWGDARASRLGIARPDLQIGIRAIER